MGLLPLPTRSTPNTPTPTTNRPETDFVTQTTLGHIPVSFITFRMISHSSRSASAIPALTLCPRPTWINV